MIKEIEHHEDNDLWEVINKNDMPSDAKTVLAIWSFKRKRYPDGRLMKHKARLCAHGGMEKWGIDYWETYAPIVNWITVTSLLALSHVHPRALSPLDEEFMQAHHRLQHLSYVDMFALLENGHLPKKFLRLRRKPPPCPSCIFGKMKKRKWKNTKSSDSSIQKPSHNKPGKCVSVDQLISSEPGLVPRISGRHTRERITAGTCFIDHKSGYGYTHLCRSTSQDETLESKIAFEKHSNTHGVTIKEYRADNGRFAKKGFRDAVDDANQTISFCGVGSHHQNGIAEKYIQDITVATRVLLLHAKRYWPEAIGTILWPFALKAAEDRRNHLQIDENGLAPVHKFSKTTPSVDLRHWHTWGCPVFVLDAKAQNGKIPKWDPKARVGIY